MNAHSREFRPALPDAHEAEESLLGAIFLDNEVYWRVAGFLKPEHFQGGAKSANGTLYETIGTMIAAARPVNPITIKPYIDAAMVVAPDQHGEGPTLFEYVIALQSNAVGTRAAYENGRAIIEMWARHRLIGVAQDLDALARSMPVDMTPEKIIGHTADRLTEIAQEGNERAASLKYGVLLPKAIDAVAKASMDASALIPWFLPEITAVAGDSRRGNLTGIMSDSGGGKTSFSLTQCRHAATCGFKTAFFSIEITEEEAALQAAAQAAGISLGRLDNWTLNKKEDADIEAEMMMAMNIPFEIVPFSECSLSDIRIKAEGLKKRSGVDQIIIDHAKMITLPGKSGDIFAERINGLYRGLKALAKLLNVHFVILIQRNDEWKARVGSGGSMRPMLGDAYGGGSIKQNLDVWFSIYRPEPLLRELIPSLPPERLTKAQQEAGEITRKQKMLLDYEKSRGKAWIINHKRRRGEPGTSQEIRFEAEFTRFASSTADAPPSFEGFFDA